MIYIYPEAEPFFLKGEGEKALLFLHGFTASPSEVLPTARILQQRGGLTVSGILLPGHGSNSALLNQTTWHDWFKAAEGEILHLRENYSDVYVAGLSMGGLLALYAALHLDGIKGVITVNAPVCCRHPLKTFLVPFLKFIRPYFPKDFDEETLWLKKLGRFAYDCYPLKAFSSMQELRNSVRHEISALKVPLLAMQSVNDDTVAVQSLDFMREKVKNTEVKTIELLHSGHISTMEEPETVAREMLTFIEGTSLK